MILRSAPVLLAILAWGCASAPEADRAPPVAVLFAPGVVSTADAQQFGVTFSPDGQTVYFTQRAPGGTQAIWTSAQTAGRWSTPERASFSTAIDESPWLAPDGSALYFVSRRPGVFDAADESDNLWRVRRTETDWGPPQPVPGGVNQPRPEGAGWPVGSELHPVIGPDGALYYWTQAADAASMDVHRAAPVGDGFGPGQPLPPPIQSPGTESSVAFGPDGMIVFQAYGREGGAGREDLFASWPTETGWSAPQPLAINTARAESFPAFSPDGRTFYFASDRGGEDYAWSIYQVAVSSLSLQRP